MLSQTNTENIENVESSVDLGNKKTEGSQENFKKKKIIIISLLSVVIFITLIASIFFSKKNNEKDSYNDDFNVVKKDNEEIVNDDCYLFENPSIQKIEDVILFSGVEILLLCWESSKVSDKSQEIFCSEKEEHNGSALFDSRNWYGLKTFVSYIVITLLAEGVFNIFLIGSCSYFFSKNKKKYFDILYIAFQKQLNLFFSFSKTKIFSLVLLHITIAFFIVIVARIFPVYYLCYCCRDFCKEKK